MKTLKNKIYYKIALRSFVSIAIVVCACFAFYSVNTTFTERSAETTKKAILRSAVSCYALEGFYPPDTDYLEEHYGLIINRSKYLVHYYTYGSNIMPEIDVSPK